MTSFQIDHTLLVEMISSSANNNITTSSSKHPHQHQPQKQPISLTSTALPLSATCPTIESWNGSLRAQILLRCYARWCLCLPLQISSHLNVVLIDAMVEAKGYASSSKLTRQLGLFHWSQVYEVLIHGACSPIMTMKPPSQFQIAGELLDNSSSSLSAEDEQRLKFLRDSFARKGINENNSSSNEDQQQQSFSNAFVEFAIDYRKAIPFAFVNICVYFMNLLCDSKETSELKNALPAFQQNQVVHQRARTIRCMNCPTFIAWSENEMATLTCPQCLSNVCIDLLKGLVATSSFSSSLTIATTGNDDTKKKQQQQQQHDLYAQNTALREVKDRLLKKGCYGTVCEQGALFLELLKSKFAMIARQGAAVVHPDRIFSAEEFSTLLKRNTLPSSATDESSSSSSFTFDIENCRGFVLGTSRPQFVEPSGVMDDWLPGLKIAHHHHQQKKRKAETTTRSKNSAVNNNSNNSSSSTFPPWLRDQDQDEEKDERCPDPQDDDDDNEEENEGTTTTEEKQLETSSTLAMRWQAIHHQQNHHHQNKAESEQKEHRHHKARRRQRINTKAVEEAENDVSEEWETVFSKKI